MSTKATFTYGPHFHLYREVLDERYIYLEVEGVPFEAAYDRVRVPIPVHVWEVIRKCGGVDLALAEKTNEELRSHVEHEVDERIRRYEETEPQAKGLVALLGSTPYGRADEPRAEQLERGMAYFEGERARQQQVREAIRELERLNAKRGWAQGKGG